MRNSIVILLAGAVIWVIYDVYWLCQRFTTMWKFFRTRTAENIFSLAPLFVAISLLLLCIALLDSNNNAVFDDEEITI